MSRPPRYDAASVPSGFTPMSGCGREKRKPCGYAFGDVTGATEHPWGSRPAFTASTIALPADVSAGTVWPAAVSWTSSFPSTVALERLKLSPPASMSDTAMSARLLAPPGCPVVDEWPEATTEPILITPPRMDTPDAWASVTESSVSRTGRASPSDEAASVVITVASPLAGP